MAEISTFPEEGAVLRRLLELMMRPAAGPPPFQRLAARQQFVTRAVYFLFEEPSDGGVERFLTHTLGRLLRQLRRVTRPRDVERRSRIRGRILWPATYKARFNQGADPGRFVCREVHSYYDTPENQVLRYLLEELGRCLRVVPDLLREGGCYVPAARGRTSRPIAPRLAAMELALGPARQSARLCEITLLRAVEDWHLDRLEVLRMEEYRAVAQLCRRYQQTVLAPSWDRVVEIGRRSLPLPGRADIEGDRWIRLGAAILRMPQKGV